MIRLALLRHGHTSWNREGRIQGRSDIPLDDDAKTQLAALCLPPEWRNAALWSSPLARAFETAQLVSGRMPRTDPALTEMNWGDWEGCSGKTLHADPQSGYLDIENWGWDFTPPNGESPASMKERLLPWASRLTTDTITVCHIGVMRVLLAYAYGWNFQGPAPFAIKRNRLYLIKIENGIWRAVTEPVRLENR